MATEPENQRGAAVKERPKVDRPRLWKVLFHNDDFTTQELVVEILNRFFGHDRMSATRIMLAVHHSGIGIAGTYPRDVAETKVRQGSDFARENGAPLLITTEPE
jgi:ATP-dependent Clp protease adaptor protein ClpS